MTEHGAASSINSSAMELSLNTIYLRSQESIWHDSRLPMNFRLGPQEIFGQYQDGTFSRQQIYQALARGHSLRAHRG